jgi:hypothetical protein
MDAGMEFTPYPSRPASLAPIYASILTLFFLGLVGLVIAAWPQAHASSAAGPRVSAQAAP